MLAPRGLAAVLNDFKSWRALSSVILALNHNVFYLDGHSRISLYVGLSVLWISIFAENEYRWILSTVLSSEIYDDWLSVFVAGDEVFFSPFKSTEDKKHSSLCKISFASSYSHPVKPECYGTQPDNLFERRRLTCWDRDVSSSSDSGYLWLVNSSDIIASWRGGSCDAFLFGVARSCLIFRITSSLTSWSFHPDCSSGVRFWVSVHSLLDLFAMYYLCFLAQEFPICMWTLSHFLHTHPLPFGTLCHIPHEIVEIWVL